jgi:hypothetical protein
MALEYINNSPPGRFTISSGPRGHQISRRAGGSDQSLTPVSARWLGSAGEGVDVRLEGREVQILPVFESRDFRLVGADEVGPFALETGHAEDITSTADRSEPRPSWPPVVEAKGCEAVVGGLAFRSSISSPSTTRVR